MSFTVKIRSAGRTKVIAAEYYCEEHGRFERDVERDENGDAPDVIPCVFLENEEQDPGEPCPHVAIWCISSPMARVRKLEAVKGKWQKPERKTWTDTSAIGEGQALYDWKEDRAAIWEERRKEDVMAFAREHNERLIGGD